MSSIRASSRRSGPSTRRSPRWPTRSGSATTCSPGSAEAPMSSRAAPSGEQHELSLGEDRAVVVEVGAGLRTYARGGREVLDGYGVDEMSASGRGQILMPWPNRIENGSYEFGGRGHQLPLTEVAARNAIHGLVR